MVVSAFSLHYPNNSVEHPVSIMSQAYNHAPLSSDDEELSSSITVRTAAETHAFVMRMIANLGESLNRANTVCYFGSQSCRLFTPCPRTVRRRLESLALGKCAPVFPTFAFIVGLKRVFRKLSKRPLRAKHAVSFHVHLSCEIFTHGLVSLY